MKTQTMVQTSEAIALDHFAFKAFFPSEVLLLHNSYQTLKILVIKSLTLGRLELWSLADFKEKHFWGFYAFPSLIFGQF